MAFDLQAGDVHETIHHHEEFLFGFIEQAGDRFPVLSQLWSAYDADPRLSPSQAGALIHELLDLLDSHGGGTNKPLAAVVLRLLVFFSKACRAQQEVRCSSD